MSSNAGGSFQPKRIKYWYQRIKETKNQIHCQQMAFNNGLPDLVALSTDYSENVHILGALAYICL